MYFTDGSSRAFEMLMQGKPGFDRHENGGCADCEDCNTCHFYRPHWKYQFCVYAECPYGARLVTAYPCGAVSYEVDKKRLSIRLTSPYSDERRAKARNYAIKNNIISNIDSRQKQSI